MTTTSEPHRGPEDEAPGPDDASATAAPGATVAPAAVRVQEIRKGYGSVQALKGVSLTVRRGTVHALVGENGSGKSTLTKIIAGAETADSGQVFLEGEEITDLTPRAAIEHGVRVIFQDLALFPHMTVAQNIGFTGSAAPLRPVPVRETNHRATEALATLDLSIPPSRMLGDLSTAERQLVAIARAVSADGRTILMDEPTAALTADEIDSFLTTVRRLADQGMSFIFISHKLREVVEVADDVTVIRDGDMVATGPADEFDQSRITELMTGGVVTGGHREEVPPADEPILELSGLGLGTVFEDVDLNLYPGRVLGLSGLVGCGKISVGLALAGLIDHDRGQIHYRGRPLRAAWKESSIQYVPDDRLTEGLFLEWSIADNIATTALHLTQGRGGLLSRSKHGELARTWQERLRIKAPDVAAPAAALSGGNQQRVLLARALAPSPDVVVLNNPTVGVDVGSRADIHRLIQSMADDGTAVLLISDEPAELLAVSDDVSFVVEGRIVRSCPADELTEEAIIEIDGQGRAA
jgi:simple sugar transport system ATP-binding protein